MATGKPVKPAGKPVKPVGILVRIGYTSNLNLDLNSTGFHRFPIKPIR